MNAERALLALANSAGSYERKIPSQRKPHWPGQPATVILVVVRSSLFNPLSSSYETVCELKEDAEIQLNISGPNFHVYLYSMDDDLRVTQLSHRSFSATD